MIPLTLAEWLGCAVVGMTWGAAAVLIRREWVLARAVRRDTEAIQRAAVFARGRDEGRALAAFEREARRVLGLTP